MGEYHSVGLLEFNPSDKQPFSLIFDLTYGNIAHEGKRRDILAIYSPGNRENAMQVLNDTYGGSWEVNLEFNKETGKFVFLEDKKNLTI